MKFRTIGMIFLCMGLAVTTIMVCDLPQKQTVNMMASLAYASDTELIMDSSLIIEGEVIGQEKSKWSNPDFKRGAAIQNILQTDYLIRIDQIHYGEYPQENVVVRVDGGDTLQSQLNADYAPKFEKGLKVLLFLCRDDSDCATDEDYFVVKASKQGQYNLVQNTNSFDRVYVNVSEKERSFTTGTLNQKIKTEHKNNPNWKEQREKQKQEAIENNKVLFGE